MARFCFLTGVALAAIAGTSDSPRAMGAEWGLPAECLAAERYAAEQIRLLLLRRDVRATWLVGGSLAGLKAARGHCLNGQIERALPIYYRVIAALQDESSPREPEVAAMPPDDGRAGP